MRAFPKPPAAVVNVTAAVMVLLSNKTKKIPKDRSWNAAKVMMGKVKLSSMGNKKCQFENWHKKRKIIKHKKT